MDAAFDDLMRANERYAEHFDLAGLEPLASRGLTVVTCMDSRLDPLGMLGLHPGEAKVLRNAGGRVTDEVLRTLVLAAYLLEVRRVLVVAHTGCRMVQSSDEDVHRVIQERAGVDSRSLEFRTTPDQEAALRQDVTRVRAHPLLPADLVVGGAVYDVGTGRLRPVL